MACRHPGRGQQAALLGLRRIALSTPTADGEPDFARPRPYVQRVLELLIGEPSVCLVNVNFPAEPKGLIWAHQSVRHYDGKVVPGEDPRGRRHFWLTVEPIEEVEEGSDRWAVERGLVAITPLRLDLTDGAELARLRKAHPLPGEG